MSRSDNGSPEADSDRSQDGRFLKGCKAGPGNPYNKQMQEFRSVLMGAVTHADMLEVMAALLKHAKAGRPWAVKEFFDRVVGKASQPLEVDAEVDTIETRELLVKWLQQEAA